MKYGMRDYRGGGRASARETAARVAAGAIARKVVPGMIVRGALVSIGREVDRPRATGTGTSSATPKIRSSRPIRRRSPSWPNISTASARRGSSVGAVIEVVADGVPAGLGAPIYGKLDQDIASRD